MRPFGRSTIWRERDNGCGEEAARRAGGEAAVGGAKPRQARPEGGLPCGPPIRTDPKKQKNPEPCFRRLRSFFYLT